MKGRICLAVLAIIMVPTLSSAQARDEWSWRGVVAKGGTLEVSGVLGDIQVTRGTGTEVVAKAVKHGRRHDASEVDIKVIKRADGVLICTLYPTRYDSDRENTCDDDGDGNHSNVRDNDVEVDFTIEVPDGVNVDVKTIVGDVEATGIRGSVDASSVTGSVVVEASGEVSAHSVSGDVRATIGSASPARDLDFKTISGDVTLTVPQNFNADLYLKSQFGRVDTDFDLTLRKSRFGESLRGKAGKGGAALDASTLSGRISLKTAR
jgi:hypothetical protein